MPIYAGALAIKNAAYTRGWLRSQRLSAPVISVGNLSVGGAGKTPLVIRLAELLRAQGYAIDVLSRGYGRQSDAIDRVRAQDEDAAARYGDEPVLIARAAGVPVYVGACRYQAGLAAERAQVDSPGVAVHLLDDGLQHRQLARAVDIVVLHRGDFTSRLLPAGRLREPLAALERASIAVLRVEDADFESEVRRRFPHLVVWKMKREIVLPPDTTGRDVAAFCGIAHPQEFFASLTGAGVRLVQTHAFRDHERFTDAGIAVLTRRVQATGARMLLTTEKDLVRLSARHRAMLGESAEFAAVPLRARLVEEEQALAQLLRLAGIESHSGPMDRRGTVVSES